jgi:PAS domain S-box-containing protein
MVRAERERLRELKLICIANLLAATGERVYFKDRQSRFLFVSEGWTAACTPGRAPRELVGKTDFDVFSEDHAAAARRDEQHIIRTGEPVVAKIELETYPGRPPAWVSTTKMPLRDRRGHIIGTFGISRDVTAQVEAEQLLARQARQLSAQNEALRELDRLKDDFVAMVSHELRTPLTSILGYAEILREEGCHGPDTSRLVDVIDRNARRLMRLVGDLLFLSQIQAGQAEMRFTTADLASIAALTVEELRPEAERKHIRLLLSAAAVPPFALDPARIGQLLSNLVANAVKFTPEGGRVEVTLRPEADQAVLTVSDTGIGIPATELGRIFERFSRSTLAQRQAIPGTGLGLTISKAIAEAHKGTITVHSRERHGSTFIVRLPIRTAG